MKIYFDGAVEPINPGGTASYGFVIKSDNNVIIKTGHEIIGVGKGMTNNLAEYTGLLKSLECLVLCDEFNKNEKLNIYGDSSLVCNIVSKKWGWGKTKRGKKTKNWMPHENFPHLKELLFKIIEILENINFEITWIPREENSEADELSKMN